MEKIIKELERYDKYLIRTKIKGGKAYNWHKTYSSQRG